MIILITALVAALWYRTGRLQRDLHTIQQEVAIQRILMDEPKAARKRRSHLHSLAVFV